VVLADNPDRHVEIVRDAVAELELLPDRGVGAGALADAGDVLDRGRRPARLARVGADRETE